VKMRTFKNSLEYSFNVLQASYLDDEFSRKRLPLPTLEKSTLFNINIRKTK
jgi:hypothetical protein